MALKTLLKRSLSGLLFAIVIIGGLMFPGACLVLMSAVALCLIDEFYRMTVPARYVKEKVCIALAVIGFILLSFFCRYSGISPKWLLSCFVPVFLAMLFHMFDGAEDHDFNTAIFFPLVYVMLPLSAVSFLGVSGPGEYDGRLLICLFLLIWSGDIGAYIFGMGFGQKPDSRKLFPALSPKKSWIGAFGGVVVTMIAALVLYSTFKLDIPLWHMLGLALLLSVIDIVGDLFESLIKRHAAVKDAGNIIPGHGGMLDRFDDVLFALPAALCYLELFSLI